jgi:hypothetical protein
MRTSTFTVNSTGDPEPIIVGTNCRKVTVGEDASVSNWPTTDYLVYGTDKQSTPVQRPAGSLTVIERGSAQSAFNKGSIVGYVATVTGSTTFLLIEE